MPDVGSRLLIDDDALRGIEAGLELQRRFGRDLPDELPVEGSVMVMTGWPVDSSTPKLSWRLSGDGDDCATCFNCAATLFSAAAVDVLSTAA
jgi:hypothetical protein